MGKIHSIKARLPTKILSENVIEQTMTPVDGRQITKMKSEGMHTPPTSISPDLRLCGVTAVKEHDSELKEESETVSYKSAFKLTVNVKNPFENTHTP